MQKAEHEIRSFADEVRSRFGVLPNFFCAAPDAEQLVQELWKFAKAGYLDSPLPSLFKERLFVHLSRFCEVRYCIVRHVGFLIGEGRPAGDASVSPQTIEQVLPLLQRALPDAEGLALCLERLENYNGPREIPDPDTQLEQDLFDALTVLFLEPRRSERARRGVACALGEHKVEVLTAFLAFVRTAHYWTETHPTLPYEHDMVAVMAQHGQLARLLLDETEAEQVAGRERLRRALSELQEVRHEQIRSAEALRLSEERLREILCTARMAFWLWNPSTDTVSASDTMDELFGLPRGEKFQSMRQGFALMHPEDLEGHRAKVEAVAREGGAWHHYFRVIRPCDGKVVWLEEHAHSTRDPETGKQTVTGLVWDVTERKHLESSLHEEDRRKDEFLATLAHELRNPLAPLRNGLQIARLASPADSPFRQTIEMMDRQLTHLVRLVDDLLDVSRISSGKIDLQQAKISLPLILASSAEAARSAIDAHGHELIVEPGPEELWVEGDYDRLTQIFSNLLTNAAKYTDAGGKIELRIAREGNSAAVSVTDNGIGIPSADLAQVFQLFSQVRVHQGRAEGGLGIGLSLVKKLVEMHHGTVVAFSEGSGKGSTFTVRLPLSGAGKTEEALTTSAQPSAAPRCILIVDDNKDAADSLAILLEQQGHEVATAYAGKEAIAKGASMRPDVVLLDLGMTGMNGIEVATHLRSLPEGERIMLVAITGWGQEQDRRRTRNAGFDHHLLKPVDLDELNKVLAASRAHDN